MKVFKKILKWGFLSLALLFMYAPIIFLIIFSFSTTKSIQVDNFTFGFDLYRDLLKNEKLLAATGNTFLIAFVSATIATLMGSVACVGILAFKNKARSAVMMLNEIPIVNADIVTAVAFVILFGLLGFGSSSGYAKLIIAHTLICLPFVVLNVLPRMRQLNQNTFEAAQDLGATPLQALIKVIIPQLLPGMVSGFMLGFTLSLDDFVISNFNREEINTISTYVYNAVKTIRPPEIRAMSALIIVAVLAILIIYNIVMSKRAKKEKQK